MRTRPYMLADVRASEPPLERKPHLRFLFRLAIARSHRQHRMPVYVVLDSQPAALKLVLERSGTSQVHRKRFRPPVRTSMIEFNSELKRIAERQRFVVRAR